MPRSIHCAQQLALQNILVLLVLLTGLICLVVLPPHRFVALLAHDVPHDVSARRHIPFHGITLSDVDHGGEEEGFAVLAAEVA
jgi:hypothetical protein